MARREDQGEADGRPRSITPRNWVPRTSALGGEQPVVPPRAAPRGASIW